MNDSQIKLLKDFLRSLESSTSEVSFSVDSDYTIELNGWDFIPGLKSYLLNEISEVLDFLDWDYMNTEITIEYDEAYDIASISHNGGFWCNIEPI